MLDEFRVYSRFRRNYTILDQFDQQYFIYQHLTEFRAIDDLLSTVTTSPQTPSWRVAQMLAASLNKFSEEAVDADALAKSELPEVQALSLAYKLYQELLEKYNYLDFSTIQVEVLRLLEMPEVCEQLQSRYDNLMIDEYQDTNTIQEKILLILSGKHRNICVVGDDDQSLYRFRGASIRNILEFLQRFPSGSCTPIQLTKNYRSHPRIVEFYNEWMQLTDWQGETRSYRFFKTIEAESPDRAERPVVFKVSGADSEENWASETVAFLKHLNAGRILSDWNTGRIPLSIRSQPESCRGLPTPSKPKVFRYMRLARTCSSNAKRCALLSAPCCLCSHSTARYAQPATE